MKLETLLNKKVSVFNLLIKLPPNPAILQWSALDIFGHLSNHLPQLQALKPTARRARA